MSRPARVASALIFLCTALGCGGGGSFSGGSFVTLPGLYGNQLWTIGFDEHNHPLVGGGGGMWRFSDAEGWFQLGSLPATEQVYGFYAADDGGTWVSATRAIYKVDPGASAWRQVRDFHSMPVYSLLHYVGSDGTVWYNGGAHGEEVLGPADTAFHAAPNGLSAPPGISDKKHRDYFFGDHAPITRLDPGASAAVTIADCRTLALEQCALGLSPIRIDDAKNTLYFLGWAARDAVNRVFSVSLDGGTPTLLAEIPANLDYVYNKSASVDANGDVYITAQTSDDPYGYGDTWRFPSGSTSGSIIFEAPMANIIVSLDDTIYSWLQVSGGVARYQH